MSRKSFSMLHRMLEPNSAADSGINLTRPLLPASRSNLSSDWHLVMSWPCATHGPGGTRHVVGIESTLHQNSSPSASRGSTARIGERS